MRRFHRVVMLATFIAVAPVLAGCENFDPDKLDVFHLNEKKKLPGDRKPLFPEGVPGVSQGIPQEYMKGNEQQQAGAAIDTAQTPAAEPAQKTAAVQPAAETKPKVKPKRKPKPREAARPPTQVTIQPSSPGPNAAQAQQPAPAPWPEPAQQQPQQAQSPWPAPAQSSSTAPWPSAPPPGTFSKQ